MENLHSIIICLAKVFMGLGIALLAFGTVATIVYNRSFQKVLDEARGYTQSWGLYIKIGLILITLSMSIVFAIATS